jgi:hypothetical protein
MTRLASGNVTFDMQLLQRALRFPKQTRRCAWP